MAIYKLDEIAKIINGSKPSSYEGQYRILGSGGYFGWTNKYKTDNYSIMLPRKGTMKIMWIEPKVWNVDTAFLITKVNQEKVLMKYLYYELKINSHWMEKLINSGTTRPATRLTEWRKLELSLPPIEEQQKIIDIIEPIESLINKSIKIKSRIEELINNKKWEENKKIEDFVLAKNSGFPYTKDDKKNDGKYKIFTIKNITSKTKFETTDLIKNNKINFGDVITGLSGTIGTADINIDNDWVSNQRTLCLGSNHSLLIQQSIIKQKDFLFQQATGAVQKNIKAKDILNLKMLKENKHDLYFNNLYLVILKTLNNLDKIYNLLINLLIK